VALRLDRGGGEGAAAHLPGEVEGLLDDDRLVGLAGVRALVQAQLGDAVPGGLQRD
jgi:hypothetical protein